MQDWSLPKTQASWCGGGWAGMTRVCLALLRCPTVICARDDNDDDVLRCDTDRLLSVKKTWMDRQKGAKETFSEA